MFPEGSCLRFLVSYAARTNGYKQKPRPRVGATGACTGCRACAAIPCRDGSVPEPIHGSVAQSGEVMSMTSNVRRSLTPSQEVSGSAVLGGLTTPHTRTDRNRRSLSESVAYPWQRVRAFDLANCVRALSGATASLAFRSGFPIGLSCLAFRGLSLSRVHTT